MAEPRERDVVFNVVVTPETFRSLGVFTRSLLAHSEARFRLVANGCGPDELRRMRAFERSTRAGGRVEVLALASATMVPHGVALDEIYAARDDGASFCFVDSDVKAKRPFMGMFLEVLRQFDAVTSCNVAWSDDTVLPAGARDLVGRHAVGEDGFVYGSSYLAMYSRPAVERVREQWGVTFRTYAHEKLPSSVQQRLVEMGRRFDLYDTAKVLNILFQGDGFRLQHVDNPALVHVGGISQYLSDPSVREPGTGADEVPWFAASASGRERWDFARWAAAMLRSLLDGEPAPELPVDAEQRRRAVAVRRELVELVGDDAGSEAPGGSVPPRADS